MTLKTRMEKIINSSISNIGGMVVLKKGQNVYEKYFNGCNADSTLHISSVTKSIISILIGIAIDKGYLESLDQKVLDFFPEYTVKNGEKIFQSVTLKDLMTMTAPYKHKEENYKIYTEYFASEDWVTAALDLLGGRGKIGEFRYTPLIGPDILSGVLTKVTGQTVRLFAAEHLFMPLGITVDRDVTFRSKEEQLAYYDAKHVSGWAADPKGINTAGWGLALTARDMAKIGQLCLNGGVWKGKQIVTSKWIDESTKEHSRCKELKLSYGYLWWIIDEKEHIYAAMGDGGNIIYVNADKEMVVAIACLYKPQVTDRIKFIKTYVEPVFK